MRAATVTAQMTVAHTPTRWRWLTAFVVAAIVVALAALVVTGALAADPMAGT